MRDLDDLVRRIIGIGQNQQRIIIAIAGPPASGKSSLSEELQRAINNQYGENVCSVVPMDGFHLDNAVLDKLGLRHVKGAPQTFDANGFVRLIKQLKEAPGDIAVPIFDRHIDRAIANGAVVRPQHKIILTEGNYLLLGSQPWLELRKCFNFTIFINPGLQILESRLVERWLQHGLPPETARARAMSNDIPNARLVIEKSGEADMKLPGL
jgi:pantothenate kinase